MCACVCVHVRSNTQIDGLIGRQKPCMNSVSSFQSKQAELFLVSIDKLSVIECSQSVRSSANGKPIVS